MNTEQTSKNIFMYIQLIPTKRKMNEAAFKISPIIDGIMSNN